MIQSHSACTYVNITHRGYESISSSHPNEIGICFTPIPFSSIQPETSSIPGENIPRCSSCSAFYNKFNQVLKSDKPNFSKFRCSLCGRITETNIQIDAQNEIDCIFRNEVYESIAYKGYFKRLQFTPTDFFIISLNSLKRKPSILESICRTYFSCYQPKQVGLAVVHGAITVIKFRPFACLQTFSDCAPICKYSQLFASYVYFRSFIPTLQSLLLSLEYVENDESSRQMVDFAVSISTKFGSSLYFILDEAYFHNCAGLTVKNDALRMCTKFAQASLFVFFENQILYRNPLIDFPVFTGGFLKFFHYNDDIFDDLKMALLPTFYHDSFLFIRPPDFGGIIDYAGQGFLQTNTGVCLTKVQSGDTFYFTIESKNIKNPYMQFVMYYTTCNDERRLRVITYPFSEGPVINLELIRLYAAAMVAQRIFAENFQSAQQYLMNLKKKFSQFNYADGSKNDEDKSLIKTFLKPVRFISSYWSPSNSTQDTLLLSLNAFTIAEDLLYNETHTMNNYPEYLEACIGYRNGMKKRPSLSSFSSSSGSSTPPPQPRHQQQMRNSSSASTDEYLL